MPFYCACIVNNANCVPILSVTAVKFNQFLFTKTNDGILLCFYCEHRKRCSNYFVTSVKFSYICQTTSHRTTVKPNDVWWTFCRKPSCYTKTAVITFRQFLCICQSTERQKRFLTYNCQERRFHCICQMYQRCYWNDISTITVSKDKCKVNMYFFGDFLLPSVTSVRSSILMIFGLQLSKH